MEESRSNGHLGFVLVLRTDPVTGNTIALDLQVLLNGIRKFVQRTVGQ